MSAPVRTHRQKFRGLILKMAANPEFIAYYFARFCELYGRTLDDIANELGCSPNDAVNLAMCGAPRDGKQFADVCLVAAKYHVWPTALARVLYLNRPELAPMVRHKTRKRPGENVQVEHSGTWYD